MSTDQPIEESTQDDTSTTQEVKIDVNGRELTPNELADEYKRLQGEFTRKSQKLSAFEKAAQWEEEQPKEENGGDEIKNALNLLRENGVLTREDLEAEKKQEAFFTRNSELAERKNAITKLANADWISVEEAVVRYGFSTEEKLERARQRDIVGTAQEKPQKSVKEMTSEEWNKWKKENNITKRTF